MYVRMLFNHNCAEIANCLSISPETKHPSIYHPLTFHTQLHITAHGQYIDSMYMIGMCMHTNTCMPKLPSSPPITKYGCCYKYQLASALPPCRDAHVLTTKNSKRMII